MVGSAPIDDGWCGHSDHSGQIALALITLSEALMLPVHLSSNFKHVAGFECHDRVLSSTVFVSKTIDDAQLYSVILSVERTDEGDAHLHFSSTSLWFHVQQSVI